ncbi:MAG: XdhC family protein [Pseudomonadota bacterium]
MDQLTSTPSTTLAYGPNRMAIEALHTRLDGGVLAIITATEGPSYRPIGAAMAIYPRLKRCFGSLSSGCIEGDLIHHAASCLEKGIGRTVRYGIGSPYMDIQLPCGGALEVTLIPLPSSETLTSVMEALATRKTAQFSVHPDGFIDSSPQPGALTVNYEADIHFTILGKGPEATMFASLAIAAGYSAQLFSPDRETREIGAKAGCETAELAKDQFPKTAITDRHSAIVLFFHDHDWEPALLAAALETNARYIGAQGSLRARATRDEALRALEVSDEKIRSLHGPIGLVPSARDPQTLAVSVLAEALAIFKAQQ